MEPDRTILIVDDNPDDRENYIRLLKKNTETICRCHEVAEGRAALEFLGHHRPDCILLDYSLPGANGLEVLKQIKLEHPDIPTIIMTGQGNESVAVQAIKMGADNYLVKSATNVDTLGQSIHMAMEHHYLQRKIDEQTQALFRNETDRQKLIEKLMQSNTELERFAYVASHDMQEPVRMVINFSKILAADYGGGLDAEGRECLHFITESATRIHDMIDDLLDYARFGSENNGFTEVDGASELDHVLHNLAALIGETGAKVTHDSLPVFEGNPVQFMRLMQNLIANAIKYRSPQRAPQVHIGMIDEGCDWRLTVADNGLGVDEAFVQKIFEPFRRLHSWEQIKGTGLGLAVCKKIVENHGGRIWMTSKLGQGSTVFVSLPKKCPEKKLAA